MITKEEVEEHLGRKLFSFEINPNFVYESKIVTVVSGRIDYINKELNSDACVFAFMIDDGNDEHENWKSLALNRIKFKVNDFLKERELIE